METQIISGIILSNSVIEQLKDYQSKQDNGISRDVETITEAVIFITSLNYSLTKDERLKAFELMADLLEVKNHIESFKPE